MELDERSRARLRALSNAAGAEFDDATRDRIARRVAAEGPAVLRRARRVRIGVHALGGCLALGLGSLLVWSSQREEPTDRAAEAPEPPPTPTRRAAAPPTPRACEQRAASAARPSAAPSGGQRYDLGELGVLVAAQPTTVSVDAADACRVRVRLEGGSVAVHARDLGGGELRVVTPSGEVTVHGTVFAVSERGGVLTVDVDEGRVSVTKPGPFVSWTIDAGMRLRVPADGRAAPEPLAPDDRLALRKTVGLAPGAVPVGRGEPKGSVSAEVLVAEADRLWRAGERDRARDRYRRAGALAGVTAEAAWLALARRELSLSHGQAARAALASYRARFPRGKLAGEALGIDFRAAVQQRDHAAAQRIADELQSRHPGTPQAAAAARWSKQRAQGGR